MPEPTEHRQTNDSVPAPAEGELRGGAVPEQDTTRNTSAVLETKNGDGDEGKASSELTASAASTAAESRTAKGLDFSGLTPMLDLMRRPSDQKMVVSLFTARQDGGILLQQNPELERNGRRYWVPRMPPGLYRSLVLPTQVQGFHSTRELFFSIQALLKKHVSMPTRDNSLLTYWALATWFPEFLPFLPSLAITGTPSAADFLLQTLVAVCRRPILLADVGPAALAALPLGELMPTLLIREAQISKRMAALLDASTQAGYLVSSGKDFQQFYCPKCIYIGEHAENQLRSSHTIQIHVGGNSARPLYRPPTEEVIRDFQNRLLTYRLVNRDKVAASNFHVSLFRPEVCAMAEALGAAIVDDTEIQGGIIKLLEERDEQARVDRANGQNGVVLRAALFHCHQDGPQVFVREIAATANQIYSEEGESLKLSSETVGHVLKSLGLYSRRVGNAGRGLILDKATQTRVHRLSKAYEVLPAMPDCAFCQLAQTVQSQAVVQDV